MTNKNNIKYIVKIFYDLYEFHEFDGSTNYLRYNGRLKGWQWGANIGIHKLDTSIYPLVNFKEVTEGYIYYNDRGEVVDINNEELGIHNT